MSTIILLVILMWTPMLFVYAPEGRTASVYESSTAYLSDQSTAVAAAGSSAAVESKAAAENGAAAEEKAAAEVSAAAEGKAAAEVSAAAEGKAAAENPVVIATTAKSGDIVSDVSKGNDYDKEVDINQTRRTDSAAKPGNKGNTEELSITARADLIREKNRSKKQVIKQPVTGDEKNEVSAAEKSENLTDKEDDTDKTARIQKKDKDQDIDKGNDTGNKEEAASDPEISGDLYTVVKGDCLWNIAKARYGSGIDYIKIYEANRDVIGDNPDLIYPGTVFVLP